MTIHTRFVVESNGRRYLAHGFYADVDAYLDTLPGYTRNQVTVGIWKLKVTK